MPGIDDATGDLPVTGSVVVPASALSWRFSRSSGPGGQGVNTADSRVQQFPRCNNVGSERPATPGQSILYWPLGCLSAEGALELLQLKHNRHGNAAQIRRWGLDWLRGLLDERAPPLPTTDPRGCNE